MNFERSQMSRAFTAVQSLREGCACSQAILSTYGEPLGLSRETAMRLSAGFAGGMRMGGVCGAVTGAVMVLGLRYAQEDSHTREGRGKVYLRVDEFFQRFRKINGSMACRDLLGCDIGTAEGMKQAQEKGLFNTICVKMVRDAAEILEAFEGESK